MLQGRVEERMLTGSAPCPSQFNSMSIILFLSFFSLIFFWGVGGGASVYSYKDKALFKDDSLNSKV